MARTVRGSGAFALAIASACTEGRLTPTQSVAVGGSVGEASASAEAFAFAIASP